MCTIFEQIHFRFYHSTNHMGCCDASYIQLQRRHRKWGPGTPEFGCHVICEQPIKFLCITRMSREMGQMAIFFTQITVVNQKNVLVFAFSCASIRDWITCLRVRARGGSTPGAIFIKFITIHSMSNKLPNIYKPCKVCFHQVNMNDCIIS